MAVLDLRRCPICQARDSLARQTTQLESRIHVTYECQACGTLLAWLGDEMWLEADRWSFQKVGRPERADLLYRSMTVAQLRQLAGEQPPAPRVLPEKPPPQPRRPVWVEITPAQEKARPAAAQPVEPEPEPVPVAAAPSVGPEPKPERAEPIEAPPVVEPEPEPVPVAVPLVVVPEAKPEPVTEPVGVPPAVGPEPKPEPEPEPVTEPVGVLPVLEPETEPVPVAVAPSVGPEPKPERAEPIEVPPSVEPEPEPVPVIEPVEVPPVMEPEEVPPAVEPEPEPEPVPEPVQVPPVAEPEPEPVEVPPAVEPEPEPARVEVPPVVEPEPVPVAAKPEPWIVELPGAPAAEPERRASRARSEQRRREPPTGPSQQSRGRGSPFLVISVGLVLLCLICSAAAMIIYSMVGNWPPEATVPTNPPVTEVMPTEAPIPTATPLPTATPIPTETPAPTEVVDDVACQGVTGYLSSTGSYYLVGEVLNGTADTLRFVEVLATFFDGNGEVVGTSSTFTELSFVAPGGTAPFKLTALDFSQFARYELRVDYETTTQPPIQLEIVSHGGTPDSGGWYRIIGEVRNPHGFMVKFPEVVATFYNGAHDVVRVEVTFAQADPLESGQSSPFEVVLTDPPADMRHYDLQTEATQQ